MLDTTNEIIQKQREIFWAKTSEERFLIADKTIEFGRIIVESNIRQENPNISAIDLKIAVFKRYYQFTFSEMEINVITASMRNYFQKKSE